MSLYHVVFLLLLFGVVIEYWQKRTPKILFFACFAALTLMLCLRFGQGTDYAAYRMIYYTMPANVSGMLAYRYAKAEMGWRLITMLFRMTGVSFDVFVFLLSAFQMWMLWRFLKRYCKYQILALFIGYHTLYLTYLVSAMRQGTVIIVFLGLLLPWLLEGKWLRYLVATYLLMNIHSVAMILLLPVVFLCLRLSVKHIVALVAIGFSAGIILSIFDIGNLIAVILPSYAGETDISVVALLERVATFVLVTYMYYLYNDGLEPSMDDPYYKLYKIYAFGILIYGLLMWSPLISSRTIFALKALEIPLITTCITKCRKGKMLALVYLVLLCTVLYVKNIDSSISQAEYLNTNIWNYPYYTIWDKDAAIAGRAETSKYYEWLYQESR